MPGKRAIVDFRECDPKQCPDGVCTAVLACPRKVMTQDAPYEIPMPPMAACRGCAECEIHCPRGAVKVVNSG